MANITEVYVKIVEKKDNLLAFAHITLDDEIDIVDLRIIQGKRGPFIAMPNRRSTLRCNHRDCTRTNPIGSNYCSKCGGVLPEIEYTREAAFTDIIYPRTTEARKKIDDAIFGEYYRQLSEARNGRIAKKVESDNE